MNKLCKHGIILTILIIIFHSLAIYTTMKITPIGMVLFAPALILTVMTHHTYKTNICCDISKIVKENKK